MSLILHRHGIVAGAAAVPFGRVFDLSNATAGANVTGDGTSYQIDFSTVNIDSDNCSVSSGTVTFDEAGTYIVAVGAYRSGGGTPDQFVTWCAFSDGQIEGVLNYTINALSIGHSFSFPVTVAAGVTMAVYINDGGGSKVMDVAANATTFLQIKRVAAS